MWSNDTRFSSKIIFCFTHNKWVQTIWILFVKLLNFSSLVTSFVVSQCLRPSIGVAEKYGMNTCTLIFLDPVKLSGSTTNSQESQNLKMSLLQMTATDTSKKHTKQKFPNSWSSSMKWSMQSNTKSNSAPIKKCWSMIRTRFLKRLVRF